MLMAEPPRTPYDLNFQVAGFPVRVHPLFWLISLIGGFSEGADGIWMITWMFVVFISILIHELGHAFLMRHYGRPAHIVLYMMGGLAIEGHDSPHSSSPWSSFSTTDFGRRSRTPTEQIVISIAGPVAGFILAALVVLVVYATRGSVTFSLVQYVVPNFDIQLSGAQAENFRLLGLIHALLYVNIFWGLMNLLPVYPLDGGQIAQQLFNVQDPWGGTVKSLWLSVIVGGAVALFGAFGLQSMFIALLFASLAASSYMTLQQMTGGGHRPW